VLQRIKPFSLFILRYRSLQLYRLLTAFFLFILRYRSPNHTVWSQPSFYSFFATDLPIIPFAHSLLSIHSSLPISQSYRLLTAFFLFILRYRSLQLYRLLTAFFLFILRYRSPNHTVWSQPSFYSFFTTDLPIIPFGHSLLSTHYSLPISPITQTSRFSWYKFRLNASFPSFLHSSSTSQHLNISTT
jgi:hypothetical protein